MMSEDSRMSGITVTDEERKLLEGWTEIDGDLDGCSPDTVRAILGSRLAFGRMDAPRSRHWQVPEGVDCLNDIAYVDDDLRAHKLDLYLPHDALLRNGRVTPVYIDIHGGGFMYGYKELNRNFCTHLAQRGFAVFSVNYRLVPRTDFMGQLDDVLMALTWIKNHLNEYPVSSDRIFVTGDSAGGTLALYALAVESDAQFARTLGLKPAGLRLRGAAFVSGLFDLTPYVSVDPAGFHPTGSPTDALTMIAPSFFGSFVRAGGDRLADLTTMVDMVRLPPVFLNTSADDFLQGEALKLAEILCRRGRDFELHDLRPNRLQALGHVYPVAMTWLEESIRTLDQIHDFSYDLI